MHSSSLKSLPSTPSSSSFTRSSKLTNSNPNLTWIQLKPKKENQRKLSLKSLKFIRSSVSKSNNRNPNFSASCSAITEAPVRTFNVADKLYCLVSEFQSLSEPIDRVKRLLHYATLLPPFDESARVQSNRVMGCTAQVWLGVEMDADRLMRFRVDSDSEITKGFCSCLIWLLDGAAPEEVLEVKTEDLMVMNVGLPGRARSRVNTWHNVLISMQKRTKDLVSERDGEPPSEPFPSLVVRPDGISAKGSYAEVQAKFLFLDKSKVELVNKHKEKKIDVATVFPENPEVEGVLTAAQKLWPHIHISDSLIVTHSAIKMAKAGWQLITVLGVDFMSKNVHAILDRAGFRKARILHGCKYYRIVSENGDSDK